jgi:hypothetical protein
LLTPVAMFNVSGTNDNELLLEVRTLPLTVESWLVDRVNADLLTTPVNGVPPPPPVSGMKTTP